MRKIQFFTLLLMILGLRLAYANPATIVAHEEEKYFYKNKVIQKFEGQYEYTYLLDLEKNTLVRTRIFDFQTKKITPDETVYQIQNQLNSHPSNSIRFGTKPMIRAFAQVEPDAVEVIVIKDDFVQIVKSTSEYIITSHAKRLK